MSRHLIYLTLFICHQLYLTTCSPSDMDFIVDHYHTEDTNFSCETVKDGIYADVESDCRKFYVCEKTVKYHFSCPNGMRFFQRFETCSFVPADEEANFNCNEQLTHESRSLKSQSLQNDEITEDTESHNMERRDDALNEENVDANVDVNSDNQQQSREEPEQQEQQEQPEQSEPSFLSQRSLTEAAPQYHVSPSGHFLSELSFLTDDQGPAYYILDRDEPPTAIQERESVDEEPMEPENIRVSDRESTRSAHHTAPGYTLCTIANVRSRRELRCL